jgi:hypothetical protein
MTPEVIHAGERARPGSRQALGDADPHQQATCEARTTGDGQEVEIVVADTGAFEGRVQDVREAFEVVAGGELGHHAAEFRVEVDLGVDDVGEDAAAISHDSD